MDVAKHQRIQTPWRNWDITGLRRNLGVYIHIPFCRQRCRYCDYLTFDKHRPQGLDPTTYFETLLEEVKGSGKWVEQHYGKSGRVVDTVYIGGGTPAFPKPQQLVEFAETIRESFPVDQAKLEFTAEMNPEDITATLLAGLFQAGVNRLSVGVQAAQDKHLAFMTRTHRWGDIEHALAIANAGPITNLSLDLIYALPGLTFSELREAAKFLLQFNPTQIAAYELTIEDGTPLKAWANNFPQHLPGTREIVSQQCKLERQLASAGYYRYEVCSYAKPGGECRHNLRYWAGGDYLGLGLGAASRIGTKVFNNPRGISEYQQAANDCDARLQEYIPAANAACAPPPDAFLQLRLRLGLESGPAKIDPQWIANGWLKRDTGGRYMVTRRGMNFADAMAVELV